VVISFLDEQRFLRDAIESVLAQTHEDWELLLVDDGSTDGSTEIAREYAASDPERIRYLEHAGHVNRGLPASRNLGIRNSRANLIALLDADDVWLPTKLETQVALMEAHPSAGMLYTRVENWHGWTGDPADAARDEVPELGIGADRMIPVERLIERVVARKAIAPWPSAMLVRRSVTERVGGFAENGPAVYEDQVFAAKMNLVAPVYVAGEVTVRYRQHPNSMYAVSRATGRGDSWRRHFLRWLLDYLENEGKRETETGRIARAELSKLTPVTGWRSRVARLARIGIVAAAAKRMLPEPVRRRIRSWTAARPA
jgi:glycosyltransferase involved in cell wall biosynthesis